MKKITIQYTSPLDALTALAKRLSTYENQHGMESEEFFYQFSQGQVSDDVEFIEWANDYQSYLAIRSEIEKSLADVA